MKKLSLLFTFLIAILLSFNGDISAQEVTSAALGAGTSSSATRGPFQRSDDGSSSVYSRANLVYTAAELTSIGITDGAIISQINWDLGSTNVITATGDATVTVYMKNSSVTEATLGQWADLVSGAPQVGTYTFNLANNFPGVKGFLDFPLSTDFAYTGETIEILVEWNCSNLIPADPSAPNQLFSGDGSLNWRWDNTAHNSLVYRAGSSSAPSGLTSSNNLKSQRVNTQFVTIPAAGSMQSGCVGAGTSSSATRGPFQRSDDGSSSVYSRANLVYTEAELANMGIVSGAILTDVSWDLGSTNVITASGDATLDVYMKNSSVTDATLGEWADFVSGATQVGTYTFNLANNFPGVKGFVDFPLSTGFVYMGGTIEVLVEWNCSNLIPADPSAPNQLFSGDGSLNWRWDNTAHNSLVYRAGSSSAPSSLTSSNNLKSQRANTCFGYTIASIVPPSLPFTFSDAGVDYELAPFGNNMSAEIAVDPADPTNMVLSATKTEGADCWAGVTIGGSCLETPIVFASNNLEISVDVYSPIAGSPILLKVEECGNPAVSAEVIVNTTVAGAWETLTFDFSSACPALPNLDFDYGLISVFPQFVCTPDACGNTNPDAGFPASDMPYYFDNIVMPTVAPPVAGDVTFCVDMTCVEDITTPSIFGNFNFWDPDANLIADPDGDGIYCATINLAPGFHEYKFRSGPGEEEFEAGASCTITTGAFTNRIIAVDGDDTVTFGWQSCDAECFLFPAPMEAAPTPTGPAENVISLFSNIYTDVPVDTWRTVWSQADFEDVLIEGDETKFYSNLNFVGIETTGANSLDVTEMNTFHVDIWTANMSEVRIKLVDFGADNNFQGGDDSEHEITISNPNLEEWISLDIPLSEFTNLTGLANISQLIFSGNPSGAGRLFVDNVYFRYIAPPALECRQPTSTTNTPGLCGADDVILLPPFILDPDEVGDFTIEDNALAFYPIGTTIVTYTLTNADGSTSVCEKEVIIADNEVPVVGPCETIIAFIDPATCMATVNVDFSITDNCGVASIAGLGTFTMATGLYDHPVTATDVNGNVTVHDVTIEIHDSYGPEFDNCPTEQVVLTDATYPASMMPTASDNCGMDGMTNNIPEGGLPAGESTVVFTAEDAYGNTADCEVSVLVSAGEIISLHPASDIGATLAENENSQIVTWNPLNATTECSYCEETSLEGFTFVGNYWGHQYFLANEVSLTRQDAQLMAEGYDAHLAVISTLGENNYLKEALSNEVRTAWIGLMPQNINDTWSFVWDNDEANIFNALDLDMSAVTENTRIVLSQDGDWVAATDAEEKYFLIERPCVDFTQVGPYAPSTSQLLRSGDAWPEGEYEVTYAAVDMCGNESQLSFDVNVQPEVSEFCTTAGTDNSVWIEGVTFHDLTNTSASNEGYANFAETVTTMNIGDGVVLLDLNAGGNTTDEVLYWRVWLDRNNDGDFFDAGEVLFEQSTENAHLQANITLAEEAVTEARLRVAVARHAFPAPCGNPYVGEVEDYTVTLTLPTVIDVEKEPQVHIFPNPADTYVNVDLSDFAGEEVIIRVINNLGKSVSFTKEIVAINGNVRLDLKGMTGGMYNISVSTNKRQFTKRLVVSNVRRMTTAR